MIYYILFAHWINDFLGQNLLFSKLEIGKNKSKNWEILVLHVCLYTLGMFAMTVPFWGMDKAIAFAIINSSAHFVIDAVTSRVTSWAYANGHIRLFWNTIGFDQFLHVAILCATL